YGKNGTGEPNDFSFLAMLSSLRKRLPNRVISFYFIGPSSEHAEYRGLSAGQLVDYAWNPYYNQYNVFDVPGLPKERYGAAAIDLSKASGISLRGIEKLAQRTVDDGFGAFVTYELQPGDQSAKVSAFTRALYGSDATYTGEFVL
ncbi:MAG: chitinase, partial [Dermabacter sp.]|nr:chitinase [Dermabacter sp.]